MPRLFTGLEVPESIARDLALHRGGLPGARWIEPDLYHITLRFLGDVDGRVARDVEDLLGTVGRAPIDVELTGLDAFGGSRPRALIATVAPHRALADLQAEHERVARQAGLPPEPRKFTPHVTLARLNGATSARHVADYLAMQGHVPRRTFTAERFVLFSARASTGGGPYLVERGYRMPD